jgi:hypothetical protein
MKTTGKTTGHMAGPWHPEDDATPTPRDVEHMVGALEGRHGTHAADVADFFSTLHALKGDAGRSWAWAGVAQAVRQRIVTTQAKIH